MYFTLTKKNLLNNKNSTYQPVISSISQRMCSILDQYKYDLSTPWQDPMHILSPIPQSTQPIDLRTMPHKRLPNPSPTDQCHVHHACEWLGQSKLWPWFMQIISDAWQCVTMDIVRSIPIGRVSPGIIPTAFIQLAACSAEKCFVD